MMPSVFFTKTRTGYKRKGNSAIPFLKIGTFYREAPESVKQEISIVQKCLVNGIFVRECVYTYFYPVMPIFSRRYLLASRDVATEAGFRRTRRRLPGLPRCKPHLCDHCRVRWYSFLRYRLSKTAMTFFGISAITHYASCGHL